MDSVGIMVIGDFGDSRSDFSSCCSLIYYSRQKEQETNSKNNPLLLLTGQSVKRSDEMKHQKSWKRLRMSRPFLSHQLWLCSTIVTITEQHLALFIYGVLLIRKNHSAEIKMTTFLLHLQANCSIGTHNPPTKPWHPKVGQQSNISDTKRNSKIPI